MKKNKLEKGNIVYWRWKDWKRRNCLGILSKDYIQNVIDDKILELYHEPYYSNYPTRVLIKEIEIITERIPNE
jgi:hypothetical protein